MHVRPVQYTTRIFLWFFNPFAVDRIFNADPLRQKDPQQFQDETELAPQDRDEAAAAAGAEQDDLGPLAPPGAGDTAGSLGGGQMTVTYAEMLFRCNFVAFVSAARPKQVQVWDDFRKRIVVRIDMEVRVHST